MTRAVVLSLLVGCSPEPLPVPARNLAIDFVSFVAPEAACRALDDHTAVCRLPDKSLVFCTAGKGRPACEALGAEKAGP